MCLFFFYSSRCVYSICVLFFSFSFFFLWVSFKADDVIKSSKISYETDVQCIFIVNWRSLWLLTNKYKTLEKKWIKIACVGIHFLGEFCLKDRNKVTRYTNRLEISALKSVNSSSFVIFSFAFSFSFSLFVSYFELISEFLFMFVMNFM